MFNLEGMMFTRRLKGILLSSFAIALLLVSPAQSQVQGHDSPAAPDSAAPMGDMMMRMQMHMMSDSVIHQRVMSDSTMHAMMMEMMSRMTPEQREQMMQGMHGAEGMQGMHGNTGGAGAPGGHGDPAQPGGHGGQAMQGSSAPDPARQHQQGAVTPPAH